MTPLIGKTHKPSRDMIAIECTNIRRKRSEGNKRVEKDMGGDTSRPDTLPILRRSSESNRISARCLLLGRVGVVVNPRGIYGPSWGRLCGKAGQKVDGMRLPLGYEFDLEIN